MKSRRTKIVCTLSSSTDSIEDLAVLYEAGMNVIRVNMAYANQQMLQKISQLRSQLEREKDCYIPIIMDLKGSNMRLGRFNPAYGVALREGEEIRISTDDKLIGDKNIVSCDCENLGITVEIGDKILVDYGRISLTVKRYNKAIINP